VWLDNAGRSERKHTSEEPPRAKGGWADELKRAAGFRAARAFSCVCLPVKIAVHPSNGVCRERRLRCLDRALFFLLRAHQSSMLVRAYRRYCLLRLISLCTEFFVGLQHMILISLRLHGDFVAYQELAVRTVSLTGF
jgi:hypothetical protein